VAALRLPVSPTFVEPMTSDQRAAIQADLDAYFSQVAAQDKFRLGVLTQYINATPEQEARDLRCFMMSHTLLKWLMDRATKGMDPLLPPNYLLAERKFLAGELKDFSRRHAASERCKECGTLRPGLGREFKAHAAKMSKVLLNPKLSQIRRLLLRPGIPGRPSKVPQESTIALSEVEAHLKPIWKAFTTYSWTRARKTAELRRAIAADSLFCSIPENRLPSVEILKSPHLYPKRLARLLAQKLAAARAL